MQTMRVKNVWNYVLIKKIMKKIACFMKILCLCYYGFRQRYWFSYVLKIKLRKILVKPVERYIWLVNLYISSSTVWKTDIECCTIISKAK